MASISGSITPRKPSPGPPIVSPSKYPQRNRKRNRFFFDDDEDEKPATGSQQQHGRSFAGSGKKARGSKQSSPIKSQDRGLQDRKTAQRVGLSLRTLLKLPKAHKWVSYEWFYANIDQPLFLGDNDFQQCLGGCFPQLKTRNLKKVEWAQIRRLMGKPRRCSMAFFTEERSALNMKRNKIRHLQQQKNVDVSQFRDLPSNIPLSLVIGTQVTALLRSPQDGLFSGTIDAVDTFDGSYRITFHRTGIGSHPVPDYEVLSNDPPEFISLSSFQAKNRTRYSNLNNSPRFMDSFLDTATHESNNLTKSGSKNVLNGQEASGGAGDTMGSFPIKFLALLVRLTKILSVKKRKIYELKSMNCEVEKMRSLNETIPLEFKKQYAGTILDLDRLNLDLKDYLTSVNNYSCSLNLNSHLDTQDASSSSPVISGLQPEILRAKFLQQAKEITNKQSGSYSVKSECAIDLISHLVSIMIHLKSFSETEVTSFELKSLQDALNDTSAILKSPQNQNDFENNVQVPVNHIQSSLSHLGNLGAFAESSLMDNCQ